MGLLGWISYSTYFGAWLNGWLDGKKGIPGANDPNHSPYEKTLSLIAEENIRRVNQRWIDEDKKLKGKYCEAKMEYNNALNDLNKESKDHEEALQDYKEAQQRQRESSTYPLLSHKAYLLLIIIIGLSEFPLTAFVFDILGENRLLTYIFAAALCITIPMASHFLGIFVRETFSKKNSIIATVSLVLFIGVIVGIAYMREKFFEAAEFQKVLGVQMDPTTVTVVFVFIQLFIFGTAFIASYLAHDPHPELKRAKKEFEDAYKKLKEESREVMEAKKRLEMAAGAYFKIEALRKGIFEKYKSIADEIIKIQQRMIEVYRKHNLRHRSDSARPISFQSYPTINIPSTLQELDENCEKVDDNMQGEYL